MANGTCSVIENGKPCGKPARTRGWCGKHYMRWLQHGDPLIVQHIVGDDEARFWSKVNKNGPIPERRPELGPCWVWTGSTDKAGYGQFAMGRSSVYAHRWICELKTGEIPDGHEVDHLCKNTGCVNYVSHLEVVTALKNCLRSDGVTAINARKTHCDRNHEFTEANTRWLDGGRRRSCLTCERINRAAWHAGRSEAAKEAKRRTERERYRARQAALGQQVIPRV